MSEAVLQWSMIVHNDIKSDNASDSYANDHVIQLFQKFQKNIKLLKIIIIEYSDQI